MWVCCPQGSIQPPWVNLLLLAMLLVLLLVPASSRHL
jgi:hypothetical protein